MALIGLGGLPAAHHLGDKRVFNLLPIHRMRLNKRFSIDRPTEKDIPEMVELYRKYASGFTIAPVSILKTHDIRVWINIDPKTTRAT